jgi:hypothetical protein
MPMGSHSWMAAAAARTQGGYDGGAHKAGNVRLLFMLDAAWPKWFLDDQAARRPVAAMAGRSARRLAPAAVASAPASRRFESVDERIEAASETLVAVVDPDVLAEGDQGGELIRRQ